MRLFLLLLSVLLLTVGRTQHPDDFNPEDYDDSKVTVHFKGTTGKFMEFKYELKGYGMLDWKKTVLYENGMVVMIKYTDTLDHLKNPIYLDCGNPKTIYSWDARGNIQEISFKDRKDELMRNTCGNFARGEFLYDEMNRVIEMNAYDQNNVFIVQIQYKYENDTKRKSEVSYHKQNGELADLSIAKIELQYDSKGREIERKFTSHNQELPEGKLKSIEMKWKNKKMEFMGNVSKSFKVHNYYDEEGKLLGNMDVVGFSEKKKHDYEALERYFDPNKWLTD
ncbi:MAG: hypothetical protein R2799_12450 [Crocinitomicaceae bacterium]